MEVANYIEPIWRLLAVDPVEETILWMRHAKQWEQYIAEIVYNTALIYLTTESWKDATYGDLITVVLDVIGRKLRRGIDGQMQTGGKRIEASSLLNM